MRRPSRRGWPRSWQRRALRARPSCGPRSGCRCGQGRAGRLRLAGRAASWAQQRQGGLAALSLLGRQVAINRKRSRAQACPCDWPQSGAPHSQCLPARCAAGLLLVPAKRARPGLAPDPPPRPCAFPSTPIPSQQPYFPAFPSTPGWQSSNVAAAEVLAAEKLLRAAELQAEAAAAEKEVLEAQLAQVGWASSFCMGVVSCYPRSAAGGTSRPGGVLWCWERHWQLPPQKKAFVCPPAACLPLVGWLVGWLAACVTPGPYGR